MIRELDMTVQALRYGVLGQADVYTSPPCHRLTNTKTHLRQGKPRECVETNTQAEDLLPVSSYPKFNCVTTALYLNHN